MKKAIVFSAAALCLAGYASSQWFAFPMQWSDASVNVTHVGQLLNTGVAGANGPIQAKNGHFFDGKGNRIRFVAVNIGAAGCFPDQSTANIVAARLKKFGVNLVRFHHMDADWSNPNIFASATSTRSLSPSSLDKLSYFVSALKQNGVYTNLNLHVSRAFKDSDGVPQSMQIPNYGSKPANFFEPIMVTLQKEYATQLLSHTNPYTGLTFAKDPAVAIVEFTNENTVMADSWFGGVSNLPSHYQAVLQTQWNAWLKSKYKTDAALRASWSSEDTPYGTNLATNGSFATTVAPWVMEQNNAAVSATLTRITAGLPSGFSTGGRVNVSTTSGTNWHCQLNYSPLPYAAGLIHTVRFWAKSSVARSVNFYSAIAEPDWHNTGLNVSIPLTPAWKEYTVSFTPTNPLPMNNRVTFMLGQSVGVFEITGLRVQSGFQTQIPAQSSLSAQNYPLGVLGTSVSGRDYVAFLSWIERTFAKGMRQHVSKELGFKGMVVCSQANFGGTIGAVRETEMDIVDTHEYWQHPEFPSAAWDPVNWRINNVSMVASATGGTIPGLAKYRVAGKPYTVSEYDHPAPNDFRAEALPMIFTTAALQDWDAVYLFAWDSWAEPANRNRLANFFATDADPAYVAFLPNVALQFRNGHIAPLSKRVQLNIQDPIKTQAQFGGISIGGWSISDHGVDFILKNRLEVTFDPSRPTGVGAPIVGDDVPGNSQAKLDWSDRGTGQAVYRVASDRSQVIAGFGRGRTLSIGGLTIAQTSGSAAFSTLMLTSIDGAATASSAKMLLTAVAKIENTNQGWNAARDSVGTNWGTAPLLAERVVGTISIQTSRSGLKVFALDAAGSRLGQLSSTIAGGVLTFEVGVSNLSLWYEISL